MSLDTTLENMKYLFLVTIRAKGKFSNNSTDKGVIDDEYVKSDTNEQGGGGLERRCPGNTEYC